jgi:tRNA(adenine34) deaminase
MILAEQVRVDERMMHRCIELAKTARSQKEFPFACIIARGEEVIVETINEVVRQNDVTRHAEMVAVSMAQKAVKKRRLRGCTLYTTVEPCPMCSTAIRETQISRVVYALASPLMGGSSKWNVLGDVEMSRTMPEYFGHSPPEVRGGVLAKEAAQVWRSAHPIVWAVIQKRGCFVVPPGAMTHVHEPVEAPGIFSRLVERLLPGG